MRTDVASGFKTQDVVGGKWWRTWGCLITSLGDWVDGGALSPVREGTGEGGDASEATCWSGENI